MRLFNHDFCCRAVALADDIQTVLLGGLSAACEVVDGLDVVRRMLSVAGFDFINACRIGFFVCKRHFRANFAIRIIPHHSASGIPICIVRVNDATVSQYQGIKSNDSSCFDSFALGGQVYYQISTSAIVVGITV